MAEKSTPRIAIITGFTSGIGFETALGLARLGWRVVGIGRSAAKGRQVSEIIRAQTGNPSVSFHTADLASVADCRALGAQLCRLYPAIDLLINNAGGIFNKRQTSAEGFEHTFALNHLGYFVLTQALRPALEAAPRARIVSVASIAHYGRALELDDLQAQRGRYSGWRQYQHTKLMNVLFTRELARRLPGHVTATCLHPGFVATRFGHNNSTLWRFLMRLLMLTAIKPQQAAQGVLHLALAPELDGISGAYFDRGRPAYPSKEAQRDELSRALWDVTERLLAAV